MMIHFRQYPKRGFNGTESVCYDWQRNASSLDDTAQRQRQLWLRRIGGREVDVSLHRTGTSLCDQSERDDRLLSSIHQRRYALAAAVFLMQDQAATS